MQTHVPNVAGLEKSRFVAVPPGEERFAFLYVVISAAAIGCAMTYSWIASLNRWQTVLLVIGCLIGAWATVFSFLEVRRIAKSGKSAAESVQEEVDLYPSRTVVVAPPTGDPYPHHEDYSESAGLDQGQLTSQLTGSTPFTEGLLSRRRNEKQEVGR